MRRGSWSLRRGSVAIAIAVVALLALPTAAWAADAPRPPDGGKLPYWSSSNKSYLGTAAGADSKVWFTGQRGVLSEVYFPVADTPNQVDFRTIFVAGQGAKIIDEQDLPFTARLIDSRSLAWEVIETSTDLHAQIRKRIFTDPRRNALVMRWEITPLPNQQLVDFALYLVHNTSIGNSGYGDTAETVTSRAGHPLMVASEGNLPVPAYKAIASASGVRVTQPARAPGQDWVQDPMGLFPWLNNGFEGDPNTDGLMDLNTNRRMTLHFDAARDGNVLQNGWLNLGSTGDASRLAFDTVLGFGSSSGDVNAAKATAVDTADQVLADNLDNIQQAYVQGWNDYTSKLSNQGGAADDEYYLAAMVLKAAQNKDSDSLGIVAGLGIPWGASRTDLRSGAKEPEGGYHLVWPRDLVKFSNALITAGDVQTALDNTAYLFNKLVQTSDCGDWEYGNLAGCPNGFSRVGRFQQNTWLGAQQPVAYRYFQGTQLDETALPIMLAWRVRQVGSGAQQAQIDGLWSKIKSSADYILANSDRVDPAGGPKQVAGPWSHQERWEEVSGFSPSTIAAEIAGLACAADLARAKGDLASAAAYLRKADEWQQRLHDWTVTTMGPLGAQYFVRISAMGKPDAAQTTAYANGGGVHDNRDIVDGGFLELVRMGVRRPDAPDIAASLAVYDSLLKQSIPGKGDAWFRYNFDGYGETNKGRDFTDDLGKASQTRGRLWPLLTAERGMFDIASSGGGMAGARYLPMLRSFANSSGFIPEQVWNQLLPGNKPVVFTDSAGKTWDTDLPRDPMTGLPTVNPGDPTGSMAPLNWAMGEYITLLASVKAGSVVDTPSAACSRYDVCTLAPGPGQSALDFDVNVDATLGWTVYATGNIAELGNWNMKLGVPTTWFAGNHWKNRVNATANNPIEYKYFRFNAATGQCSWETRAANRTLTTPGVGASAPVNDSDIAGWEAPFAC